MLIDGERTTEVVPEDRVKISAQAQVIDFTQAIVAPGRSMRAATCSSPLNPAGETSTLIAVQDMQATLRAGFMAARDMSSHGNG